MGRDLLGRFHHLGILFQALGIFFMYSAYSFDHLGIIFQESGTLFQLLGIIFYISGNLLQSSPKSSTYHPTQIPPISSEHPHLPLQRPKEHHTPLEPITTPSSTIPTIPPTMPSTHTPYPSRHITLFPLLPPLPITLPPVFSLPKHTTISLVS